MLLNKLPINNIVNNIVLETVNWLILDVNFFTGSKLDQQILYFFEIMNLY